MPHTWTWDKLAKNAYRLNPKTRGFNYPYVPKFELLMIIPFVGTKSCLVKLQAWGVTQHNLHQVTLLFTDCEILTGEQDVSLWQYFKVTYKGETYYIKKFDKLRNPVSQRCTCFTGDTKVLLADGTQKSFKELEGQEFDVVSYNEAADKFEIVHAFNCTKKKDNAELLRITLDNGKAIDCTPDHRFLTRQGEWLKASELQIGTSLRAFYGKLNQDKLFRYLPDNHKQVVAKHKPEQKYYLYVYLDPRYPGNYKYETCEFEYKPIYVGKGCNNRYLAHLKCDAKDAFHNTIRKLQKLGMQPIILKQKENLTEAVAYRMEKELTEEIGLACDNEGTLLNCKHGGQGGLSGIVKVSVQQRMKNNNPMKNPTISKLVSDKNELNGNHDKFRKLFRENNPMHNPDSVKKAIATKNKLYTKEDRVNWATNASHSRTEETFKKISNSLRTSEIAKAVHAESGKKLAEYNKKLAAEGRHHTQTKEWKQKCSANGINNWKKPGFKEKVIGKGQETRKKHMQDPQFVALLHEKLSKNARLGAINREKNYEQNPELKQAAIRKCLITKAAKNMMNIIKEKGIFNPELYQTRRGGGIPSIEYLKQHGLYDECLEKAYALAFKNHSIVNIETIHNDDVYCLTTQYLGNFVVSTPDNNNILSGVVVSNCKDYFYSWGWYNYYNAHCLYGPAPRPYQRKTTTYPRRNPTGMPGICKHLYHAWEYLRLKGFTLN